MSVKKARILRVLDILLFPVVYLAALFLRLPRRAGMRFMPYSRKALQTAGVFPIINHYYEPQFIHENPKTRELPGIDLNIEAQLSLLHSFCFQGELDGIPVTGDPGTFHYDNKSFASGDAEYWYQIIRTKKPARIIEIGGGYSTLMAQKAIFLNEQEGSSCEHICIEPFEAGWLEKTGATVYRERVENIEKSVFKTLEENDILFIDSSHMIRPQGDVLFEYLEILPILNPGVIVHIHDIFTPDDYLPVWLHEDVKFWNEQYLLEAFLSENSNWKIIGALNYLHHNHYDALKRIAPALTPEREPGSFYMQRLHSAS